MNLDLSFLGPKADAWKEGAEFKVGLSAYGQRYIYGVGLTKGSAIHAAKSLMGDRTWGAVAARELPEMKLGRLKWGASE